MSKIELETTSMQRAIWAKTGSSDMRALVRDLENVSAKYNALIETKNIKVMRKETWRQDQPDQQFVSLWQSAFMSVNNILDGTVKEDHYPEVLVRIQKKLEELLELRAWMSKKW